MNSKLKENLKRIRKENNLSQEQLAEQLGVSRQSVSKWESGMSYPEMDKMLKLCEMFNLNIDELLNQDIKEIKENKQSKNIINKYIDDFLGFITKTIDMFSSMKFKQKIKCIIEQLLIIVFLIIIFLIIGAVLSGLASSILNYLPYNIYNIIINILSNLYSVACFILGLILLLHIFKTRYLDYYEIIKAEDETTNEIIKENVVIEKPKEKIIIRDEKHSEYKFISGLLKVILFCIKIFVEFIGLCFCFSLVSFVFALGINFMIIKTGLLFIGILLCLISAITVNIIILDIIFNFIFNKKSKKKLLGLIFLISLIIFGIGTSLTVIGFTKFDYVDNTNNNEYFITDRKTIDMFDEIIIPDWSYEGINYIPSDNDNIIIEIKHSKYYNVKLDNNHGNKNIYTLHYYKSDETFMGMIRKMIKDVNNKKIVNYSNFKVNIYTTQKNINKIKNNTKVYYEE